MRSDSLRVLRSSRGGRRSPADAAAQALAALRARQQEATSGVLAEVDKACDGARAELSKQGAGYDRTLAEAADVAVEEATRPRRTP